MEAYAEDPGVQWMLAYQEGSEAAFDRIVESYSPQVYSLLTRFLGAVPEREDLVQEVFLRVIRARDRYRPQARFSTYLYRIAFNLAVNQSERSRSSPRDASAGGEGDEAAAEITDTRAEEPSGSLERDDVVRAVRAAIESLPENQRMALILARYEDMAYVDIAQVLRSSEKAIKSLVHRARENLRARLAPFLEGELS